MHINHELPDFTTNGCKWVQDQSEFYPQTLKAGGTGLDRAFYRSLSEKVLKKHYFANILHAICMCIDLKFFDTFRILQEHDWRRLEFKLSKSVTPAVMLGMPFQTFTISMILDHGRRRPGQVVRRSRFWRIFLIGSHWLVNLTNNEKIWFHLAFSNSYFVWIIHVQTILRRIF